MVRCGITAVAVVSLHTFLKGPPRSHCAPIMQRSTTNFPSLRASTLRANSRATLKKPLRVCDVALKAGFSDISHFNRLFRSHFGDTPKGVRTNHQVCHAN